MWLYFEVDFDYQCEVIDVVCDLFCGQELYCGDFSVFVNVVFGMMVVV